jgi:membrane protease YdiL (CAAX protease family)
MLPYPAKRATEAMDTDKRRGNTQAKSVGYLGIFLLFEAVIRVLIQPDPWLLEPSHWYFDQPLRLLIEIGVVAVGLTILLVLSRKEVGFERKHIPLLILASLGTVAVFSLLELDQLAASFSVGLERWMLWFFTGFFIGVGQELSYRGFLYESVRYKFEGLKADVINTVAFVFMPLHSVRLVTYGLQGEILVVLLLVATYTGASILFLWLRKRTQSVAVPAIVHGFGNAITWVAVFAAF